MTVNEFAATLNEEQLRFLLEHFFISTADDNAGMLHQYHCQRGQLKEAVKNELMKIVIDNATL